MAHVTMASRMRKARLQRGLSRADFAALVGVSPTSIWLWEEKEMSPRPRLFAAITNALGVSESYLKTGKGAPKATPANIAVIIRKAQVDIAKASGVPPNRVKLRVQYL